MKDNELTKLLSLCKCDREKINVISAYQLGITCFERDLQCNEMLIDSLLNKTCSCKECVDICDKEIE